MQNRAQIARDENISIWSFCKNRLLGPARLGVVIIWVDFYSKLLYNEIVGRHAGELINDWEEERASPRLVVCCMIESRRMAMF